MSQMSNSYDRIVFGGTIDKNTKDFVVLFVLTYTVLFMHRCSTHCIYARIAWLV